MSSWILYEGYKEFDSVLVRLSLGGHMIPGQPYPSFTITVKSHVGTHMSLEETEKLISDLKQATKFITYMRSVYKGVDRDFIELFEKN